LPVRTPLPWFRINWQKESVAISAGEVATWVEIFQSIAVLVTLVLVDYTVVFYSGFVELVDKLMKDKPEKDF